MTTLPYEEWRETLNTLHMWTQIVGKVQLALAPPVNHSWHVAQHVTARGLSTQPLPHGERTFQIDLDLVEHACRVRVSDGREETIGLGPMATAEFYDAFMMSLDRLGLPVKIWPRPVEVQEPVRFDQDTVHRSYDAGSVTRFFHTLAAADRMLRRFRGGFIGKSSPVHFFWGSFDLAVTRFSGRTAPPHPGGIPNMADRVTRDAYSHELFSAGWWPGNPTYPRPAFYAYAYPAPEGFAEAPVVGGSYLPELGEFVLPWPDQGREQPSPDEGLAFLRSAYEAAAELGQWDRAGLERP